ncbi:MAG: sulfotransferase domain-containing protein [Phycisphaerales bacterium]
MNRIRRLAWRVQQVVARPQTSLFFLRGHPRSGTNWVGALLNLHPRICCKGEFHLDHVHQAVQQLQAQTWHVVGREPVRTVLDECVAEMVRRCAAAASDKPGATILGDRTPHTLPVNGSPMVPGAPFILAQRDGRDVLVSWRYHLLRQPPPVIRAAVPPALHERFLADAEAFRANAAEFSSNPERLLTDEAWVRYAAQRWANWVTHDAGVVRKSRNGERRTTIHAVRYETLHTDLEPQRAAMYRFLGLDPADAEPVSQGSKTAAGFGREDNGSFFRHGEVGDWKTYLTGDAKTWFKEAGGAGLIELGYEKDLNW